MNQEITNDSIRSFLIDCVINDCYNSKCNLLYYKNTCVLELNNNEMIEINTKEDIHCVRIYKNKIYCFQRNIHHYQLTTSYNDMINSKNFEISVNENFSLIFSNKTKDLFVINDTLCCMTQRKYKNRQVHDTCLVQFQNDVEIITYDLIHEMKKNNKTIQMRTTKLEYDQSHCQIGQIGQIDQVIQPSEYSKYDNKNNMEIESINNKRKQLHGTTSQSVSNKKMKQNINEKFHGWKMYHSIYNKYEQFLLFNDSTCLQLLTEEEIELLNFIDPRIYQSCYFYMNKQYNTDMWERYFQYEFPYLYQLHQKRQCNQAKNSISNSSKNCSHRRDALFNITKQYHIPIFKVYEQDVEKRESTEKKDSNTSNILSNKKNPVSMSPYHLHETIQNMKNRKLSLVNLVRKINALSVY